VAAKTFWEWHGSEAWHGSVNDFEMCWNAATDAAVEKFKAHNTGSPKLPQLEDVKREAFAEMSATYGMPATNSEIVSMVYGIIERQLRAGA
jgi:hypothetical protein